MFAENSNSSRLPLIAIAMSGIFLTGWFFCAGTGSFFPNWLGIGIRVWFGIAVGLHLVTLCLSAAMTVCPDGGASALSPMARLKVLFFTLVGTLLISAVLLTALIKFEAPNPDADQDQDGYGNSTSLRMDDGAKNI